VNFALFFSTQMRATYCLFASGQLSGMSILRVDYLSVSRRFALS